MWNDLLSKIGPALRLALAVSSVACVTAVPARAEFGEKLFKLTASDAASGDLFYRCAISGNIAIVGAYGHAGSAYLFDVTTGHELHKLTASDAALGNGFGSFVGISGNTAVVNAYVFDVTTGQELRKLTPSDASPGGGFGAGVRIDNNTAIVGAPYSPNVGAAYVFDVPTWQQRFKLTSSDGPPGDNFGLGMSIGLSGNIAVVGARLHDGAGYNAGAAYVFDLTTGQQLRKLTASDAQPFTAFGNSVAVKDNIAIIGAPGGSIWGGSGGPGALLLQNSAGALTSTERLRLWGRGVQITVLTSFVFAAARRYRTGCSVKSSAGPQHAEKAASQNAGGSGTLRVTSNT